MAGLNWHCTGSCYSNDSCLHKDAGGKKKKGKESKHEAATKVEMRQSSYLLPAPSDPQVFQPDK